MALTELSFVVERKTEIVVGEVPLVVRASVTLVPMMAYIDDVAPDLIGMTRETQLQLFRESMERVLFGAPLVMGSLVFTCWHCGEGQQECTVGVRVACLGAAAPLLLEVSITRGVAAGGMEHIAVTLVGESAESCLNHPVKVAVMGFLEIDDDTVASAIVRTRDAVADDDYEIDCPGAVLMSYLAEEPARVADEVAESLRLEAKRQKLAAQDEHGAMKRKAWQQKRQIESLEQQLETARATAARERAKAGAAEGTLRSVLSAAGQKTANAQAGGSQVSTALQEQLRAAESANAVLHDQLDQAKQTIFQLEQRVVAYQPASAAQAVDCKPEHDPTSLREMERWLGSSTDPSRIFVHPKAIRSARKSVFGDISLIYRVLHALDRDYWDMKFGSDESASKRWAAFLAETRLTCNPTGAALSARRTSDAYQVVFEGRRYPLDMHIQGSSSRKEQAAFRLYFHPCVTKRIVLVGHFPTHLPNTLS